MELVTEAITLGVTEAEMVSSKTGAGISELGYDIMGRAAMMTSVRCSTLIPFVNDEQ